MKAALLATCIVLGVLVVAGFNPSLEGDAVFFDNFQYESKQEWNNVWKMTKNSDYNGKWRVMASSDDTIFGEKGDKGLVMTEGGKRYSIVAPFDGPVDLKKNDLVIQYEVRLQDGLTCGGAYLKLLANFDASDNLVGSTPYTIMFGPDKCGSTNKVHFIFRFKNPISGEYEEKHLKSPPSIKNDKLTHLYTLHLRSDNTFVMEIDQQEVASGSLLENFEPSVNPSKMIDDPADIKPEDWVDNEKMPDPEAVKPDDWDEDAPRMIPDPEAVKPADWLEDVPLTIPNPDAEQPQDYDEEANGPWKRPSISNPRCKSVSGCGPWEAQKIANPAYKGKWTPPMITNPAYKGEWKPRQIENKFYFEENDPVSQLDSMNAIGFELLTNSDGVMFDNVLVCQTKSVADAYATKTWKVKSELEQEKKQASAKTEPKKDSKKDTKKDTKKPKKKKEKVKNSYRAENRKLLQDNLKGLEDLNFELMGPLLMESYYTWWDWVDLAVEYSKEKPLVVLISATLATILPLLLLCRRPKLKYLDKK